MENKKAYLSERCVIVEDAKVKVSKDDVALMVKAKYTEDLVRTAERASEQVCSWMDEVGLEIAPHKTEAGCSLYKIKLADSPRCLYGDSDADTVEHTLLECNRWTAERRVLYEKLRVLKIKISDLVPVMIRSPENCNSVHTFMETLIHAKEKEARRSN
ncbi:uncharacterized protein LOC115889078 [Sitophilus oryzae]|uniref:Uncharacterized protein LOC115889078 n=1 Tax=Sitophilus oryzae TaxID=7048 RepID=A0A6J2YLH5_SITOR|nr:uncharacterized protein LOC115889078 [Sitophilus oryzae]